MILEPNVNITCAGKAGVVLGHVIDTRGVANKQLLVRLVEPVIDYSDGAWKSHGIQMKLHIKPVGPATVV